MNLKPKVISFDVDGTLVNQDFANKFWHEVVPRLYAKKHGLNYDEALSYVRKRYAEVGEEDIRWYLPSYWFKRFGLDANPLNILKKMRNELEIYKDAIEALEELYDKYELIVISNASKEFLEVELEKIRDYFSKIYSCVSDFGEVRKRPEVYLKVCKSVNANPKQILHVGDHHKFDYVVPKQVGIDAYLIDRYGRYDGGSEVLRDLRELKLILNRV
ncbi:HAD family hydrolase [Archaeoglobales archaeon]|nr:MAG: HAD family hydrolase [Archaeoglobales archaeon]